MTSNVECRKGIDLKRTHDMRVMLKAQADTASGNRAMADGTMGQLLQDISKKTEAEAIYIGPLDGKRTLLLFFDLEDASSITTVTEPFFEVLEAEVEITPVMTLADVAVNMGAPQ